MSSLDARRASDQARLRAANAAAAAEGPIVEHRNCSCPTCQDNAAYPTFERAPGQPLQEGVLSSLLELYGQKPPQVARDMGPALSRSSSVTSMASVTTAVARPSMNGRRKSWFMRKAEAEMAPDAASLSVRQKRRRSITVQVSSTLGPADSD